MTTRFKIITPAFNCAENIRTTLYSVIGQSYGNWEMIVIDDMSTDNTASMIKSIAIQGDMEDKIIVKSRKEKYGEVKNTIVEVANCDDNDVVVRLDAGDYITDLGCFEILDHFYREHDPAVLWTSHRWGMTDTNISGAINPDVSFYEQRWRSSHLKTFRVRDFRGLNPTNFLDENGEYFTLACDQAIFLPMLERARRSGRPLMWIPGCMYQYNTEAVNDESVFYTDRSKKQKALGEWIRARGYIE